MINALFHSKFIEKTCSFAEPNLRVNGRNLEDLDEDEQGTSPLELFDHFL
jgi:hypothetical protein